MSEENKSEEGKELLYNLLYTLKYNCKYQEVIYRKLKNRSRKLKTITVVFTMISVLFLINTPSELSFLKNILLWVTFIFQVISIIDPYVFRYDEKIENLGIIKVKTEELYSESVEIYNKLRVCRATSDAYFSSFKSYFDKFTNIDKAIIDEPYMFFSTKYKIKENVKDETDRYFDIFLREDTDENKTN